MMTAEELITRYLEVAGPIIPKKPKGSKTLAQKQGARKAGRTKSRRQYTENAGYLYYNYYRLGYDEYC